MRCAVRVPPLDAELSQLGAGGILELEFIASVSLGGAILAGGEETIGQWRMARSERADSTATAKD